MEYIGSEQKYTCFYCRSERFRRNRSKILRGIGIGYLNNPSLFRPELRRVIFLDRPVRERRIQVYGRSFRLVLLSFLAGYSLIKRKHRKCLQLR